MRSPEWIKGDSGSGIAIASIMSWLFEKSRTWRIIVATTKRSPLAMAGFTVFAFATPYYLGSLIMQASHLPARFPVPPCDKS